SARMPKTIMTICIAVMGRLDINARRLRNRPSEERASGAKAGEGDGGEERHDRLEGPLASRRLLDVEDEDRGCRRSVEQRLEREGEPEPSPLRDVPCGDDEHAREYMRRDRQRPLERRGQSVESFGLPEPRLDERPLA